MAIEFGSAAAGVAIAKLLDKIVEEASALGSLGDEIADIRSELRRLTTFVNDVSHLISGHPRNTPALMESWRQRMNESLAEANNIVKECENGRTSGCINCRRKRKMGKKIRGWKTNMGKLIQEANHEIRFLYQIPPQAEEPQIKKLVHATPHTGFVGEQIQSALTLFKRWLIEDAETRLIVVYGVGGVGKTSVLKHVYNSDDVQNAFDVVIWTSVSQNRTVKELQTSIALRINLKLNGDSSEDERAMELYTTLKKKRFILILEDVWNNIDMDAVGVPLEKGRSKIVLSTRNKEMIRCMDADQSIEVKPLVEDESWNLFQRRCFGNECIPREIEEIARGVAEECKGLPLAIITIAAAMAKKMNRREWVVALKQLRTVDNTFFSIHDQVQKDLLQRLKWSYDALSDDLKHCFLCCAMFPEDHNINVENLIRIWIAEGHIKIREADFLVDLGRTLLDILIDRCLVEVSAITWDGQIRLCKMHDVIRDLAIYIAQKEERCLFRAGQNVKNFPLLEESVEYTRISLMCSDIDSLPEGFVCPTLLTLVLADNEQLLEIPSDFLDSFTSLKVLDLGETGIKYLPPSLGRLKSLVYLGLAYSQIEELPDSTGDLSKLQFLDLCKCTKLKKLPSRINGLKCLKDLNLTACKALTWLPHEISQLTALESLSMVGSEAFAKGSLMGTERAASCLTDIVALRRLTRLEVELKSPIPNGVMGCWAEMRWLVLECNQNADQYYLPADMQKMEELELLCLDKCHVVEFSDWICDFKLLQWLRITECVQLQRLPAFQRLSYLKLLDIRACLLLTELPMEFGSAGGFPMLESLFLGWLPRLESMVGPKSERGVLEEGAMPRLETLTVRKCEKLKKLPMGMHKLKSLKVFFCEDGDDWWEKVAWEEGQEWEDMKLHLQCRIQKIRRELPLPNKKD
eukprot:Gb_08717 [translate_table: standard]